jgi:anaerobic magnesium-protoporphyrin IX monomethyl ester cyclase
MPLDALIISHFGPESISASSLQKLSLDGHIADIQTIINYVQNNGKIVDPVIGTDKENWSAAPTLNGVVLSEFLNHHGYSTELINDFYRDKEQFTEALRLNPRIIVVSTSFVYSRDHLVKFINDIRQQAPDAFIVAGGPFVYRSYLIHQRSDESIYSTKEIQQFYLFFDNIQPAIDHYVVSLRGEAILCELINALRNNKSLKEIPNTAYYEYGSAYFTKRMEENVRVADFFLSWDKLDKSFFSAKVVSMQASIGCPYQCAFCNFNRGHRLVLSKPLDQVILELKEVAQQGVKYVWFVDDNFMLGTGNLNTILARFVEENIGIKWMSYIRADALKNVDYQLLRRSGCVEVQLGLESADPSILSNMQKKADPFTYRTVVENILKEGINCACYFIFGFPGETEETAQRTREFIQNIEDLKLEGALQWSFYPFMLLPLSPIFEEEQRKRFGITGCLTRWSHATMNTNQALQEIQKTIISLTQSGAMYRSDNLALLNTMSTEQKKAFYAVRNALSKRAITETLQSDDVIRAFIPVLPKK